MKISQEKYPSHFGVQGTLKTFSRSDSSLHLNYYFRLRLFSDRLENKLVLLSKTKKRGCLLLSNKPSCVWVAATTSLVLKQTTL